jgi:hypothetical protein
VTGAKNFFFIKNKLTLLNDRPQIGFTAHKKDTTPLTGGAFNVKWLELDFTLW